MNRFDKLALVAAILATMLFLPSEAAYNHYAAQIPKGQLPIGITGWLLVTYGPILTAALFWRWAKRIAVPWVLHLLFFPCAVILFRVGEELMLGVIQDPDFDATIDAPLAPALFLMLVAIAAYYGAMIRRWVSQAAAEANAAD